MDSPIHISLFVPAWVDWHKYFLLYMIQLDCRPGLPVRRRTVPDRPLLVSFIL